MEGDSITPTKLVGKKVVPILEKEDGTHIFESMDIVRYIDKNFGQEIFDDHPHEDIEDWIKEIWKPTLGLVIPRFTKADFPELNTKFSREFYTEREKAAFGDLNEMIENTNLYLKEVNPLLDELDTMLSKGHELNIVDFDLYAILRSLTIVDGIKFPTHVHNYILRMEELTNVETLYKKAL